jgi:FtsH-binding integral membrane protein
VTRLLWGSVALLVAIGVTASVNRARAIATGDSSNLAVGGALSAAEVRDIAAYDSAFASHPLLTVLHIAPGPIFLVLAPLQFSSRIRTRHLRLHRWSGRVLVLLALVAGVSGLLLVPHFSFTGSAASWAALVFGTLFVVAILRAFVAIRRRDVVRHREWMIRAFSIAIGISVVRIVGGLLVVASRAEPFDILGWSFWIGWLVSFAAGEWWIRRSRFREVAVA